MSSLLSIISGPLFKIQVSLMLIVNESICFEKREIGDKQSQRHVGGRKATVHCDARSMCWLVGYYRRCHAKIAVLKKVIRISKLPEAGSYCLD